MNTKQEWEGFMFITSGCEHGPTVMIRNGDWNKEEYKKRKEASWCDPCWKEDRVRDWAAKIEPILEPGKRYKLTIEEI